MPDASSLASMDDRRLCKLKCSLYSNTPDVLRVGEDEVGFMFLDCCFAYFPELSISRVVADFACCLGRKKYELNGMNDVSG